MARKQRSAETIIHKLREAEILISQGKTVKEAAKQIGVTDSSTTGRTTARRIGS